MKSFSFPKYFFIFVIIASIAVPVMMFRSFNKVTPLDDFNPSLLTDKNFAGNIDTCIISGNLIAIAGWAADPTFTGDMYRANIFPIINVNGKYYKLRPTKALRIDISSHFKRSGTFDYSGFESQGRISGKNINISKKIYLVSDNGELMNGVAHVCE